jgi:hypothetical protein
MVGSTRHRWLYAILLDDAVLRSAKFRAANPARRSGMPCIYVGSTGLTPAQRFERHRAGVKSNPFVQRHGIRVLDDLCCPLETNRSDEAEHEERLYAEVLRRQGYAVWQN